MVWWPVGFSYLLELILSVVDLTISFMSICVLKNTAFITAVLINEEVFRLHCSLTLK